VYLRRIIQLFHFALRVAVSTIFEFSKKHEKIAAANLFIVYKNAALKSAL